MKILKECPLLVLIVAAGIILSVISFAFKDTAYAEFKSEESDIPVIALAFKGASQGVFPWTQTSSGDVAVPEGGEAIGADSQEDGVVQIAGERITDADIKEAADGSFAGDISGNSVSGNSAGDISGNSAEEEVYEFGEVDEDYFTDALFIGDSRTVGLSEYCEPLDTRATFYSKVSLTIYDVMTKEFIKTDEGKVNVETALSKNQYAKIYIMLGLNEIGTGTDEYFTDAYKEVLDRIRELQPDAIIYIQGIMHVSENKSSHDKYFNNENINRRNEALSQLADNKTIFYIDMNEAIDDENGNLDATLTFDDIHLKASSYERWYEFLLHNAIVR
jgi:hypothetical protein